MQDLDNIDHIKLQDTKNVLTSITLLPDQCEQAWHDTQSMVFPQEYKQVKHIVCAGMGGSAYGARIVKSLFDSSPTTHIPMELSNTYWLPGYVGQDTLVILASYSGTTEETIACAEIAKQKGAKILGLTSGGPLADFLRSNKYPAYIFDPKNNPSHQPRIGQGYMQIGLLGMLSALGFIPVKAEDVLATVEFLRRKNSSYIVETTTPGNPAKQFATSLVGKIPVVIVADFLEGAAHAIRNPFHETAKQFALYFVIPELNHHLMEGLKFPDINQGVLKFIFVESNLYDSRNTKRMMLTKDVVKKNGIPIDTMKLEGASQLMQTMELISFGSFVTFYLADLNRVDPGEVPWVDYFKSQLK